MSNLFRKLFKPRLKLVRGTRLTSFLFIATSIIIAAGILFAANMYYNIDTGEVVTEEIHRVTGLTRAIGGLIVGGTATSTLDGGYGLEVATSTKFSTGTVELTATNQLLKFTGGTSYYIGFKAPTDITSTKAYILPQHGTNPPSSDYVLTWQTGDQLTWKQLTNVSGAGDITAVGDVSTGDAFVSTAGTSYGNTLWFHPNATYTMALTANSALAANATATLPVVSGTIALGTGSANQVAYWSATNTLAATATLPVSMGGTGQNSSAWTGMVKVDGGTWSAITNTADYVAVWDSNGHFITGTSTLNVARGGTGTTTLTDYGILYGLGTSPVGVTAAGTDYYILTGQGSSAPTWRSISQLVFADNGLTAAGTATTTLKLGGTLSEATNITLEDNNLSFIVNNSSGLFRVATSTTGGDILTIDNNGKIYFKGTSGYPLAETGKQVLREMIPIMGFDLPVKSASTSYVKISRDIINYPLSSCAAGTSRVHKLVIRYGAATTTNWHIATTTGVAYTGSAFTLSSTTATSTGTVGTATTTIPVPTGTCTGWTQGTDTDDWWVEVNPNGYDIMIYQIFLAAYDEID